MNIETTEAGPLYDPAAQDYAAGRADQLAGHCDVERAVGSEEYRKGQQDERTAGVDAELRAFAEREGLVLPEQLDQEDEEAVRAAVTAALAAPFTPEMELRWALGHRSAAEDDQE